MNAPANHTLLKVPPHSLEAERSVLGSILIDPAVIHDVDLSPDEFYRSDHRIIYRAMRECAQANNPPDLIVLAGKLDSIDELENIGGMAYLDELAHNTPTSRNVASYAKAVRDRAVLREYIVIGHELADGGFHNDAQAASKAAMRLSRVNTGAVDSLRDMRSLTKAVLERIDRIQNNPDSNGVPTGFKDLDRVLGNMQPGDLFVVGARPGTGKTQFMCNVATHVGIHAGIGVGIQEAESPGLQITHRFLANMGTVKGIRFRTAAFDDDDYPRLTTAVLQLNKSPIYIDDRGSPDIDHVERVARRLKRERNIQLFCVDHVTKIRTDAYRDQKRLQVGEVTYRLKELAKELEIPIMALAQLQRDSEGRRPTLKDLKESGNIEEDADNIILLHPDKDVKSKLHAIIAKNREGPLCDIELFNDPQYMRMGNWEAKYQ